MSTGNGPTPDTAGADSPIDYSARHRSRRTATDEKIAAGVFQVLRNRGFSGLTVEAVSAESGVAKTTIYRRYADRYEMLSGVAKDLAIPDTRDYPCTPDGLAALLHDIHTIFERYGGSRAIGGLLIGDREEIELLRASLVDSNIDRIHEFFAAGVEGGQFRPDLDVQQVVEVLVGGVVFAAASRNEIDSTWTAKVAELIWPSLVERPAA